MTAGTLERPTTPAPIERPAASPGGAWRVATRLARREVRRRWGRTLLVMILVAVPVFGMTVVTVLERTSRSLPVQEFRHEFGHADAAAVSESPVPDSPAWPRGTRVVRGHALEDVGVVASNGAARVVSITDLDLDNSVTRGMVLLREGRFPARSGEALVSPRLARVFSVRVGDTLRLTEPRWTERVVGIGVSATDWGKGLIAVRGDELNGATPQFALNAVTHVTLLQFPGHRSAADIRRFAGNATSGAAFVTGSSVTARSSNDKAVNWTLVAGVIALAVAGVVISGAFAVGARRQLVTLGQLSANGADEGVLRRMLSLQGAWCGVLGTAAGLVGGIVTLAAMHARFDGWLHRDIGPYVWSGRDLVAIGITGVAAATIAAFIPARSAARVPVLSALAGRRPLGAVPRSLVPRGFALFSGGVVVLALVAAASRDGSSSNGLAAAAVLGGVLVLAGACCTSPVLIASMGGLAGRLRGAGRVAVRSIVRTRARTAAVVMALIAINAGSVAIGTAFASRTDKSSIGAPLTPEDTIVVLARAGTAPAGADAQYVPIDPAARHALETILPKATWTTQRAVVGAPTADFGGPGSVIVGPGFEKRLAPGSAPVVGGASGNTVELDTLVVADAVVLHVIGLAPPDLVALQRDGVLLMSGGDAGPKTTPRTTPKRLFVSLVHNGTTRRLHAAVMQHNPRATEAIQALITPERARTLGLPIVDEGVIVRNPSSLNESQRASIDALFIPFTFGRQPGLIDQGVSVEVLWPGTVSRGISPDAVKNILLAIVVAIALLVLAMSLALSAAETRDERDVLVSLGARPSTLRGVAAWKAATMAFLGALIAVPTGVIPVAVVYYTSLRQGEHAHLGIPWSTVLVLLVVAPLLAATIAALGSGIAQRVRPTRMSTFATD